MFRKYLLPNLFFGDIYQITPDVIRELGARALIADIDNTLVTYDDLEPTEAVLRWLDSMRKNGIAVAFVSNNTRERVERFNARLGLFASYDSGKPSTKAYRRAADALGVKPSECVAVGDQLFTDVLAAKRLGMKAVIVKPIKDKLTPLFKIKRAGERLLYRIYGIKY